MTVESLWAWNAILSLLFVLSCHLNVWQWLRSRRKSKRLQAHLHGIQALTESAERVNERGLWYN